MLERMEPLRVLEVVLVTNVDEILNLDPKSQHFIISAVPKNDTQPIVTVISTEVFTAGDVFDIYWSPGSTSHFEIDMVFNIPAMGDKEVKILYDFVLTLLHQKSFPGRIKEFRIGPGYELTPLGLYRNCNSIFTVKQFGNLKSQMDEWY